MVLAVALVFVPIVFGLAWQAEREFNGSRMYHPKERHKYINHDNFVENGWRALKTVWPTYWKMLEEEKKKNKK